MSHFVPIVTVSPNIALKEKFKEHQQINIHVIIQVKKIQEFDVIQFYLNHLQFSNGKFATNVYRKKTFSGVYTNFGSFIPETYKTGLIKSLLFRCFNLCSDFVKFHHEINMLKGILHKNSYPRDFVDKCIKEFLDRVLVRKVVVGTVPKKDLMIVLPYLGKLSLQIRTRINRVMRSKLPHCNLRIVFQTKCKLINFFTFKDKIPVF